MSDMSVDTVGFDADVYGQDLYNDAEWLGREVTLEEGNSVNAFAQQYLASRQKSPVQAEGELRAKIEWGGTQPPSVSIEGEIGVKHQDKGTSVVIEGQHNFSSKQGDVSVVVKQPFLPTPSSQEKIPQ